jgi:RNA polymerase-binding protein DksA
MRKAEGTVDAGRKTSGAGAGGKPASVDGRKGGDSRPAGSPGRAPGSLKSESVKSHGKAADGLVKKQDQRNSGSNSRERSNVRDGADAKGEKPAKAGEAKAAAPKGGSAKDSAKSKAPAPKGGAAAKAADKAPPPAPPVRKIQVMQLSTLKPGARGSRMKVARLEIAAVEKSTVESSAKKRRSAELTRQQLDHFRELLMQRRERLVTDLNLMQDEALKVTAQDNSSDSVADTGTDNYEQDFTLGLIESEEGLAREVDEALLRIEQNAFGVCGSCQTPIPLARLEILPFARMCVECQQKRESQG